MYATYHRVFLSLDAGVPAGARQVSLGDAAPSNAACSRCGVAMGYLCLTRAGTEMVTLQELFRAVLYSGGCVPPSPNPVDRPEH
jgi:hypothetical protein